MRDIKIDNNYHVLQNLQTMNDILYVKELNNIMYIWFLKQNTENLTDKATTDVYFLDPPVFYGWILSVLAPWNWLWRR